MSEHDAVLFANAAFYAAFVARDVVAMEKLWAAHRPVGCVHPGRPAIIGRAAVMESWRAILTNPAAPTIAAHAEQAMIYGETAVVTCLEHIKESNGASHVLAATNVFVKT